MSLEIRSLLSNITSTVADSTYSYSDKIIGAGYNMTTSPDHTVIYSLSSFVGGIVIQGTLSLDPTDNDWFDIETTRELFSDPTTTAINHTFSGNYTWVRAGYNLQDGVITSITVSI